MTQKVALITGVTGQDGAYLAEFLLDKGYTVHGIKRRTSLFNTDRIDHLYQDPHQKGRRFVLHYGDMTDSSSLVRIVQQVQPDEIYNLAAQSHVAVSFEEPEYTADSDALGALRVLEAIRILGLEKKTRYYQASTSELYGKVQETPQRETTPFYPRSPYGVAKLYAHWITVNYREAYGLYACNGILFNHECVAADTPILCRVNGVVDVKLPGELVALRRKGPSSQLFESPGLEVWDGQDWTPVIGISATRRRVTDPEHAMISVQARAGIVGSTTHHRLVAVRARASLAVVGSRQGSLSDEEEVVVEARAVRPGNAIKLAARLPGTPGFARLAPEMAEFLGLMAADGHVPASVRSVAQFTNNDPRLRGHVAALWSRLFLGESRAAEGSSGFSERRVGQLYLSGAGRSVTALLRDQLYTEDGFKRVPALVLNAPLDIQARFLEGYYAGDGLKAGKGDSVKTNSAVLAQGIYWLYANQGRLGSVYLEQRNRRAYYQINLPSANPLGDKGAHLRQEASEVRRIDPVCPADDQWVFDLETASGVFMAGVGRAVVHNSPIRGETFVTRKITRAMARIKLGLQDRLYLGNLNSRRDWGHARDFVEAQWLMLQQDKPEDYVIATGEQHSVREFVDATAEELEIKVSWRGSGAEEKGYDAGGRCIVAVDPRYFRPAEVDSLLGDASKARNKLGWRPRVKFRELVSEMVREDFKLAERDELVKSHGHRPYDFHE